MIIEPPLSLVILYVLSVCYRNLCVSGVHVDVLICWERIWNMMENNAQLLLQANKETGPEVNIG